MAPEILPSAVADLEWGGAFYERREVGVGDYFVQMALAEIESLRLYGGIHAKRHGFHWLMVHRFPWAIYYEMEHGHPIVYRVLDCRSHPDSHRRMLKEQGAADSGRP